MITKHFAFVRKTIYSMLMPLKQKPVEITAAIIEIYLALSAISDLLFFHQGEAGIYAIIALVLVAAIPLLLRKLDISISPATLILILVFITVATYTGNRLNAYKRFFWYDIVLHFTSGLLVSITSAELFFPEDRHKAKLSFVLFFSFICTLAVAGAWEIVEFFFDIITGNDVQRNLTIEKELFGAAWQNPGIRDTMNDMINGTAGGLVGVAAIYLKRRRKG